MNSYGRYYAKEAERTLRILRDTHEEVLEMADIEEERVSISVRSSTILPPIFKSFYDCRSNVRNQQSILPDMIAKERLISGEIELCVSHTPITGSDIAWLPILKKRLDLIVPKNHRLAEFDEIDLLEAKNEYFIGYKSGLESISMFEKCCLQAGFTRTLYLKERKCLLFYSL